MRAPRLRAALAVAVLLGTVACSKGGDDDSSTSTTQPSLTGPRRELKLGEGQRAKELDESFQYGAFLLTVGTVVWDEADSRVYVGVRYRNLSESWATPQMSFDLAVGDRSAPLLTTVPSIPPGASADVTLDTHFEESPLEHGDILVGSSSHLRPIVHLDGRPTEDAVLPASVELDSWVRNGKYAIHVTGAQLLGGRIDGSDQPIDVGQRVLHLTEDTFAVKQDPLNGWFPSEHLQLQAEDGTVIEAVSASKGYAPLSWTAHEDDYVEFLVPEDYAGTYQLQLSSVSTKSFGIVDPATIKRTSVEITIPELTPIEPPVAPPVPLLPGTSTATAVDQDLPDLQVNVGGFLLTLHHITWDPETEAASIDASVESIADAEGTSGLSSETFYPNAVLIWGGQLAQVRLPGGSVPPEGSVPVELELEHVRDFSLDDAVMILGVSSSRPSAVALGADPGYPEWPPIPVSTQVADTTLTADDFTVVVHSYRTGQLQAVAPARPGFMDLEVVFDVTYSAAAIAGSTFRQQGQVLLSRPDGYLTQATLSSDVVIINPGETKRASALFSVPDTFDGGTIGIVVRSRDEVTDLPKTFIETLAPLVLPPRGSSPSEGAVPQPTGAAALD